MLSFSFYFFIIIIFKNDFFSRGLSYYIDLSSHTKLLAIFRACVCQVNYFCDFAHDFSSSWDAFCLYFYHPSRLSPSVAFSEAFPPVLASWPPGDVCLPSKHIPTAPDALMIDSLPYTSLRVPAFLSHVPSVEFSKWWFLISKCCKDWIGPCRHITSPNWHKSPFSGNY